MELRAEDLRCNNWVEHLGYFGEVEDIQKETIGCFINGVYCPCYIKDLKPIPLTEEWLLKFGFKPCDSGYEIEILNKNQKFIFYPKYINNEEVWSYNCITLVYNNDESSNEFELITSDEESIKLMSFVHQLQNLYYALTNKELQVL